jgi:hypothetical protein
MDRFTGEKIFTREGKKRILINTIIESVGMAILYRYTLLGSYIPLGLWITIGIVIIPIGGLYAVYAEEITGWMLGRSDELNQKGNL